MAVVAVSENLEWQMSASTRKIRLYEIEKREKAIRFFTKVPDENGFNGEAIWIPRSLIHHISRDLPFKGMIPCTVEVEEWFLEKNNL